MLNVRPICAECDRAIADDTAFYIDGEWRCESCIETYRREVMEG